MRPAVLLACAAALLAASAKGAEAAFPGKNGLIAYCSMSGVQAVRPDGSDKQLLTGYLGEACGASFSPDGSEIAFYGDPDEDSFYQLFVRDLQTLQQTQITYGSYEDTPGQGWRRPSWSPDGTKIAFDRGGEGIWMMDADGSDQEQLADAGWDPEWSPDGSKIAYSSSHGADQDAVWVMDADGSKKTRLTSSPNLHDYRPEWSPGGRWIAWAKQEKTDGRYQVYKMRPDGSKKTRLTSSPLHGASSPVWSPDGRRIAFLRDGKLMKMKADGMGKKIVTSAYNGWEPDWQTLPVPPE